MSLRSSEIFEKLLDLDGSEREIEIRRLCVHDNRLLAEVRSLFAAHQQAGKFLSHSVEGCYQDSETAFHSTDMEQPGSMIGPYKLLEPIGEGGFGIVYMAQQEAPLRRRVALKIIKPGMDTKQIIARFEAERQALAVMDHPHIARVIDAGSTISGRPYFVMELVRGEPITKFCAQRQFDIRVKLRLFQDVCLAVEHAHQKGIIHRDIKPSNVLVTICDDQPMVKVIDFGIAKAIRRPLAENTLITEYRQFMGTPLYMSPEQAEQKGVDIDTRTDIYSLGVLLYEMLTGRTPIDPLRLSTAHWADVQRMIVEEEPIRPSALVSSLFPIKSSISNHPVKKNLFLSAMLRDELDWIVLKAIDKDRGRRYPTASQLASDISRYLNDEPVEAKPPGRLYLLRKFARRNRGLIGASTIVLATLMMGIGATAYTAKTALELKAQAESRERQAIRAATAAGASVLLSETEAQRLADGWLAEIHDLNSNGKTSQADLSQAQYVVWHATWLSQHDQVQAALQLTEDVYDHAKTNLGVSNSAFLSLCNLRIQLLAIRGDSPSLVAEAYSDLLDGLTKLDDRSRTISFLPQFAAALIRAGQTQDAIPHLERYVEMQISAPSPLSHADTKRLRSAIDDIMSSGKVSSRLLTSLQSLSNTGKVIASPLTRDDPDLVIDQEKLQGTWYCEHWIEGKLTERMRVEFRGVDCKTEWLEETGQVIRGRMGRFDLSRIGGVKVLTTYLDSSSDIGGTFIYSLTKEELRIVSGMLANHPSLPEIELRVFRKSK